MHELHMVTHALKFLVPMHLMQQLWYILYGITFTLVYVTGYFLMW